ncbi:MAG TPA: type II toxin-antitoxin system HigB family toxin [Tepidisphaeraceae bacterium]|jgi:mRNA interferase HigB
MTVLGQDVLANASSRNKPLRIWLAEWVRVVEEVEWKSLEDVRTAYPSADGVKLSSGSIATVFNVKGNSYRLIAWIDYNAGVVEAVEVITHAEYDKDLWKARY